ncbi:alpha/beta fold hydrolase [Oribacterium sp. C9]
MELPCKSKIIILAHSQGGLYAQQFARLYPNMIRGIVFVDPLQMICYV